MMFFSQCKISKQNGQHFGHCQWQNRDKKSSWSQEGGGQRCSLSFLAHLPSIEVISWSHSASWWEWKLNYNVLCNKNKAKSNKTTILKAKKFKNTLTANLPCASKDYYKAYKCPMCSYQNCNRRASTSVIQSLKIKLSRETSHPALVGLNSASLQLIQSFHYFQWEQLSSSSRVNGCIIMSVITNVMHIPWLARKMIPGLNRHVLFSCMSLSWAHHLGTGCHLSLFLLLLLLNMLILGSNQTSLLQACPKIMQRQLASLKKGIKDPTVSIICFLVHMHTHRHPRDLKHS